MRRLLVAATATAVAFGAFAPSLPSHAATAGMAAPPQQDPGADLPEGTVVHSWALAPAASSTNPDLPGNRPHLSYEVEPGGVVEDAVRLSNFSNVKLTFRLYATDAFNNASGDFDLLPRDQAPTDVGSWFTIPAHLITVPATSQITVPITMHVPRDATPGDHVGAVLAASDALGTGSDGKTVVLDRRTGPRVYVRVAGEIEPELAVESVETTYAPSLNPFGGKATVKYRIQNRGNVRLSGRHHVSVAGPFGVGEKRSKSADLSELLPGQHLDVEVAFSGVPAFALERTTVTLEPSTALGSEPDLVSVSRSAVTFAPPITLLFLAMALWLALRARRAYARHRRDDSRVPAPT